jgi:hypothetical protein
LHAKPRGGVLWEKVWYAYLVNEHLIFLWKVHGCFQNIWNHRWRNEENIVVDMLLEVPAVSVVKIEMLEKGFDLNV